MDENFAEVPRWMFNRKEFLSREKLVFTALCMFCNSDGECAPSAQELADFCSLGRTVVFAALKGLEEKGAISRDNRFRNGSQTKSLYTVNAVQNPNALSPSGIRTPRRVSTDAEIEAWVQRMVEGMEADRKAALSNPEKTPHPPAPSP